MGFSVLLTDDAVRDLEDVYDYIDLHDGRGIADHVLDRIEKAFNSLSENPLPGVYPEELIAVWDCGSSAKFSSNPSVLSTGSSKTMSMCS